MPLLSLMNSRHRMLPFISLWETTGAAETITLPTPTNYLVDWGDGTITTNTNAHIYADIGQYEIKIKGDINDFSFNNGGDRSKIKDVLNFGGLKIIDNSFNGCLNLDVTAIDVPTFGTNLPISSFRLCSSLLFNGSINNWDTSQLTNIQSFFELDSLFNQPLNNWDTSNLNTLQQLFRSCSSFNQDLNSWNTSLVVSMNSTFQNGTVFNGNISSWSTSTVATMLACFQNTNDFNQDISGWSTLNVTNMSTMFSNAKAFNQDISSWNFSSVTNISNFMASKTDLQYNATFYDNLLIKWDNPVGGLVFSNMINVNIGMGTIKYTAAGAAARASLISKGFIISDGGQV